MIILILELQKQIIRLQQWAAEGRATLKAAGMCEFF